MGSMHDRRLVWERSSGRGWLAAVALLACAAGPGRAPAQEQAAAAETGGVSGLQEVVVTATRREEALSKVPISVMALTEEALDNRGIKDFSEIARFTPGVSFDNSGTNNISIRGIAGTGGAGTTGIYIDDTPIQMRALAFNPDEALPKSFDIDRVEVLRGPQGTLFGAGSEGGTVRYITTQPSVTRTSMYARAEVATTDNGAPSYEGGFAVGGPLIDNTLGARITLWYRRDGGWIDDINPVTLAPVQSNANYVDNYLARLAFLWTPNDKWSLTPGIYYQDSKRNDINNFWPLYSDPSNGKFVNANPTQRRVPDKFYLASLRIQGDLGAAQFISNTSYYDRTNQDGYEGTLYNLGFYQIYAYPPTIPPPPYPDAVPGPASYPLIDGNGIHLPPGAMNYTSPSTVDNGQINISQEFRLQSSDDIEITGMQNVTRPQIMEVIGADIGRNIFFVPLNDRKQALEKIPWVESASVMRFVPNRLKIEIQERTPVAFARVGSKILLVDSVGTLMDLPTAGKKKFSFPVILGMSASEPASTRAASLCARSGRWSPRLVTVQRSRHSLRSRRSALWPRAAWRSPVRGHVSAC